MIGQLSPVGMMVASVFILKEKMRGTQIIGASMLLCGLVMFFNTSLIEIFTRLDYTWGCHFRCGGSNGLGELWRRAKGVIASSCFTADLFLLLHFVYSIIAAISEAGGDYPA